MCRYKGCGYYGSNSDGVKQANHYKFRCPRCARLYRPFAEKQGASTLFPFQTVLTVIDPITQRIFALPTTWPDTASDELLCNMAVIQARKIMSDGDAAAESRFKANANECFHNLLQKVCLPPSMQHFQGILPEARHILESAAGFGAETIAHLATNGYRGAILPQEVNEQPVFNAWDILTSGLVSLILNLPTNLRAYVQETDLLKPSLRGT